MQTAHVSNGLPVATGHRQADKWTGRLTVGRALNVVRPVSIRDDVLRKLDACFQLRLHDVDLIEEQDDVGLVKQRV